MHAFLNTVAAMRQRGAFFGPDIPLHIARAPGRLDLMGGNDDYTGGLVFEATIREATWAAAQWRRDDTIVLRNKTAATAGWQAEVAVQLDQLGDESSVRDLVGRSPEVRWTAYVLGNLFYLKSRYPRQCTGGMRIYLESDVPLNKGVSSSAAVEVAVMKAAAHAWGIDLAGVQLAEACQWGENVIAGSACGIMDQIAVVLGDEGCILPLVCQPCLPEPLIRLPSQLRCWAVDSGVSHEVSGVAYESARAAAFMGYKLICDWEGLPVTHDAPGEIPRMTDPRMHGYLANLPRSLFRERFEPRLPARVTGAEYLTAGQVHVDPFTQVRPDVVYHIRANTRYAVEENQRVALFSELARVAAERETERVFRLMGDLMYQSHHAYTECGLGSEATDRLVQLAREEGPEQGVYGAKVTGGGAGGTVAILAHATAHNAIDRIVAQFGADRGFTPYVFEGSSPGADRFGVRVLKPG